MIPAAHPKRRPAVAIATVATVACLLWACSGPGPTPRPSPTAEVAVLDATSGATGPLPSGWPGLSSPLPAVTPTPAATLGPTAAPLTERSGSRLNQVRRDPDDLPADQLQLEIRAGPRLQLHGFRFGHLRPVSR